MPIVLVMQVGPDRVVHVIAVGNPFMAATGAMLVPRSVADALMARRAFGRIGLTDGDLMLVDMTGVEVVQVSVMHVIRVPLVLDCRVPAAFSVRV
jgi:hypothetical protein